MNNNLRMDKHGAKEEYVTLGVRFKASILRKSLERAAEDEVILVQTTVDREWFLEQVEQVR